jgi:hypothetical protein
MGVSGALATMSVAWVLWARAQDIGLVGADAFSEGVGATVNAAHLRCSAMVAR